MRTVLFTAPAVSTLVLPAIGQEVGTGTRAGAASNNLGPSSTVVAYVSPEKAFADSAAGKAARAEFDKLQAEKSRSIDQKNEALRAQQAAYDTSATIMSDAARSQRQKELQSRTFGRGV